MGFEFEFEFEFELVDVDVELEEDCGRPCSYCRYVLSVSFCMVRNCEWIIHSSMSSMTTRFDSFVSAWFCVCTEDDDDNDDDDNDDDDNDNDEDNDDDEET